MLKPLLRECEAVDIVLVQLNPTDRAELPISARDVLDRLNEVTMNASLMRELDGIATVNRLLAAGQLEHPRYEMIHLHRIADPEIIAALGMRSKNDTAWPFLVHLRDAGRGAAGRWLEQHRDQLGRESTLDLTDFAVGSRAGEERPLARRELRWRGAWPTGNRPRLHEQSGDVPGSVWPMLILPRYERWSVAVTRSQLS